MQMTQKNILFAALAALASNVGAQAINVGMLSESSVLLIDQSTPKFPGTTFEAGTIINTPLQRLCATIQDYADYPSYVPNTSVAKPTPQADGTTLVDMTLQFPFGIIKKYRLHMRPQVSRDACRLSWKMVAWEGLKPSETFADTSGFVTLAPWAFDPNKTTVIYHVHTDPGPVPFGFGWLVDNWSRDSTSKMVDALRRKF